MTIKICALLLIISLQSCAQNSHEESGKHKIDTSITSTIDRYLKDKNGVEMGSLDATLYTDGKKVINTFRKNKKVPFITLAYLDGDTIRITGFVGMFAGFGFHTNIYPEGSENYFYEKTDDYNIYKLNKSDSILHTSIYVPCISSKLTLANQPEFKVGETVYGIIELKSNAYYSIDANEYYFNKGDYLGKGEQSHKGIIKAYFKVEIE